MASDPWENSEKKQTVEPWESREADAPKKESSLPSWWNPFDESYKQERPDTHGGPVGKAMDYIGGAAGDLTLQGIMGLPSMVAGGVRGVVDAVRQTGESGNVARDWMEELAYQPRSKGGKAVNAAIDVPLNAMMQFADDQGEKALWNYGDPSPLRATAVRSVLEAAPLAVGAILGKNMRPPMGTKKPKVPSSTKQTEPSLRAEPPIAPETEPTLTPRQQVKPETATDRARAMAEQAGISWDALSGTMKTKVTDLAKDATSFKAVDKASLERIMRGESLPVPVTKMTKGQATRDPGQLRAEDALAATDAGIPIREAQIAQNKALIANLDAMEGRTGSRAKGVPEKTGGAVAEGGIAVAAADSKRGYQQLYKEADASAEGAMPLNAQPLVDWVIANESNATVAASINTIRADLKKMGIVRYEPDGEVVLQRKMTMRESELLRQKTHDLWDPHQNGLFMGRLRRVIDKMTENGGGDLYKGARAARNKHAMEFEEPEAIAQLITDKSRTDRKISLENVWHKSVLTGSLADIRILKKTLFNSKDKRVKAGGRKAWKEIAGETVRYIREQATKGVATDAAGNLNLSPAGLKRALDKITDAKLEIILGKTQAKQLRDLQTVSIDTKTIPPYKGGSTTAPNLLAIFDKLSKFPIAGPITRGVLREGADLIKKGKEPAAVRAAMAGPELRQTPTKKRTKLPRKPSPPSRISPMIPLSALAIPTTDQERKLAPFYSQNVTIDRARTGSIGRGK